MGKCAAKEGGQTDRGEGGQTGRPVLLGAEDAQERGADGGGYGDDGCDEAGEENADQ